MEEKLRILVITFACKHNLKLSCGCQSCNICSVFTCSIYVCLKAKEDIFLFVNFNIDKDLDFCFEMVVNFSTYLELTFFAEMVLEFLEITCFLVVSNPRI